MRALEEFVIRNWRKEDLCYVGQKFCPTFVWKAELVSDEIVFYLSFPRRVLKVNVKKRHKLRGKLLIKKIKRKQDWATWEILILSRL